MKKFKPRFYSYIRFVPDELVCCMLFVVRCSWLVYKQLTTNKNDFLFFDTISVNLCFLKWSKDFRYYENYSDRTDFILSNISSIEPTPSIS